MMYHQARIKLNGAGMRRKRVMVVAPHPDDDILGCGGSICWHCDRGHEVSIIYLTSGESGAISGSSRELKIRREEEARMGAAELGVSDLTFMGWPDGGIEVESKTLDSMIQILRQKKPHIIYFPHCGDMHRDHTKSSELVGEALRRAAGPWHPLGGQEPWETFFALAYEIWSPLSRVNLARDITPYIIRKREALLKHASQLGEIAYKDAIVGLNRYRGVTTGRGEYCECFQIVKACW